MKTLTGLNLAVCLFLSQSASAALTLDAEFEIRREKLFTLAEYEKAKAIMPAFVLPEVDAFISAVKAGHTHLYSVSLWVDGVAPDYTRQRAKEVQLTTPSGSVLTGRADEAGDLIFEDLPDQKYFSVSQLQSLMQPGAYQIVARFTDGSSLTGQTTLAAYSDASFPTPLNVTLAVNNAGVWTLQWPATAPADEFEIEAMRFNDWATVYESGNVWPASGAQITLAGATANQGSYFINIDEEHDASNGAFRVEFVTATPLIAWQPISPPRLMGTRASDGTWDFTWPGTAGYAYQLQVSTNLVDWQNQGSPLAGIATTMTTKPAATSAAQSFYRLAVTGN
jgi:hypothetical protein